MTHSDDLKTAAQGLTPRLLLAVTPTTIHILDWDGSHVHREFLSSEATADKLVMEILAGGR